VLELCVLMDDATFYLLLLCRVCGAGGCRLMGVTADDYVYSNAVDMYNSVSGTWSTAQLSVGRRGFAATSVGNVAIFAGGATSNCSFTLCDAGFVLELYGRNDACLRRVFVAALWCLRYMMLPSHEGHCR
jgi:hypothetical protein